MNPFLPLALLTTDIKQLTRQLSDLERRLHDSRCLYATAQDILVGGEVKGQIHALSSTLRSR